MSSPAGWHRDPSGKFDHRYWDGLRWTEHVSKGGQQMLDPVDAAEPAQASTVSEPDNGDPSMGDWQTPDHDNHDSGMGGFGGIDIGEDATPKIAADQMSRAGLTTGQTQGGGTLFTEPILLVNQKTKLIEVNAEYTVMDQHGNRIGAVREVGQSTARKVVRVVSNIDQFMKHRFEVVDATGAVVLELERPGKVFKSKVLVSKPATGPLGAIVQENVFGKIRFRLEVGGQRVGSINAENWRAWNFSIRDSQEQEVARITKTWEGLARTLFTTADRYVVQLHSPLQDPLLSMVVASAVSVDTALKQDSRGLN